MNTGKRGCSTRTFYWFLMGVSRACESLSFFAFFPVSPALFLFRLSKASSFLDHMVRGSFVRKIHELCEILHAVSLPPSPSFSSSPFSLYLHLFNSLSLIPQAFFRLIQNLSTIRSTNWTTELNSSWLCTPDLLLSISWPSLLDFREIFLVNSNILVSFTQRKENNRQFLFFFDLNDFNFLFYNADKFYTGFGKKRFNIERFPFPCSRRRGSLARESHASRKNSRTIAGTRLFI